MAPDTVHLVLIVAGAAMKAHGAVAPQARTWIFGEFENSDAAEAHARAFNSALAKRGRYAADCGAPRTAVKAAIPPADLPATWEELESHLDRASYVPIDK